MPIKKSFAVFLLICLGALPLTQAKADQSDLEAYQFILVGRTLSPQKASVLERQMKTHPDDLSMRTILLGYYFRGQFRSKSIQTAREKHILWIIQNHPEAAIAGLPEAGTDPYRDAGFYSEAKKAWTLQVERNKNNPRVLANAAGFLELDDKAAAEKLLEQGRAMEPQNPDWPRRLGHLFKLKSLHQLQPAKGNDARRALAEYEKSLALTTDPSKRFYLLPSLAEEAYESGDFQKAENYAKDSLREAGKPQFAGEGGDAFHHANLVLGRIALRSGDTAKAGEFLIRAGRTPGSTLLDSYGPNMTLAKELLEKGETKSVLVYFRLCSRFWRDKNKLNDWTSLVKKGKIPDFRENLEY
jgi:hypothetical protein